jgi:photosystem II stability/assembly factor-like uncharacterized protein
MPLRRVLLALFSLLLVAGAVLALMGGEARRELLGQEAGCPPGYLSGEQLELRERRERRAQGEAEGGEAEREREAEKEREEGGGESCRTAKGPEPIGELMQIQNESGRRARGGQAGVKTGAYASAVADARQIATASGTLPGSAGEWTPAGKGPLIGDDKRFNEVNGQGLADQNGRPSDFAFDAKGRRLYAAVGEGGVWVADEKAGFNDWRSIGDTLPTQAVGGIDFSPADGGTVIVSTGDNVFGGGGTFSGLGVFRTTDEGRRWQRASGVPDGIITFKVAVDPTNPQVVYAATGAGLFRSTDAGASFANVNLPTGQGVAQGQPDCTGAAPDKEGCALANMVTDVVVQGPRNDKTAGAAPGSVVAAVGWRAGNKQSAPSKSFPGGYVEAPSNGIYRSGSGAPGTFSKVDTSAPGLPERAANGFAEQKRIGRVELGEAAGPDQDHNYLYAIVEDAERFRGGIGAIDVPEEETGPVPGNTVLNGIYVSPDFGKTWTRMADAEQLKDPTSGSALTGTACATLYCPGVQAWYNLQIAPDPTRQNAAGVPTRMVFGLEEVWKNKVDGPLNGPTQFDVVGPYFAGDTCLFLNTGLPECPTTAGSGGTTTHPDQHASIWIPQADGAVTLAVGNDGGVYVQKAARGAALSADNWGRGANRGFNTLLPYDAQVAKDGTIYAGLQDNGELKIQPDGTQVEVYGGDGAYSAVDPGDSKIAYESYTFNAISKTVDGGATWSSAAPPDDTYQFINPFTMDPADAGHLITAGNKVWETTNGAGEWKEVFDLGTRTKPGDAAAEAGENDPENSMSAIDVRGLGQALPSGGKTADFDFEGAAPPSVPGGGTDAPGTFVDKAFTIGPNEGNSRATIEVTWDNGANDWDLVVYRKEGDQLVEAGTSGASPPATKETVVLTRPKPGDYVIRVRNFAATGAFKGTARFVAAAPGDTVADRSAAYAGYCGYCDALNTRPFANGIATNVSPGGDVGKAGAADGWHVAKAQGLPKRYITSVQIDPADVRTVYVTLGGYSRRWLKPGVLGEDADLGGGNVYKSTDAGETFRDISGNLPDIPANWTLVRGGQLLVATNLGVFVSADANGGRYEALGSGLPTAPVFSLELKPKASPSEPDTLVAATQGRGVYKYAFKDPAKACTSGRALTGAKVKRAGKGLKLSFERSVRKPVTIDIFQQSIGRRVVGERLVARFKNARQAFRWNGRANRKGQTVRDGIFMVRFRLKVSNGLIDNRRIDQVRRKGRFSKRPPHYGREGCTLINSFKLERPVFGGTNRTSLGIAYRLLNTARVTVTVKRGKKVVKRYRTATRRGDRTHRLRFSQKGRKRGDYKVTVRAKRGSRTQSRTLTSRKL